MIPTQKAINKIVELYSEMLRRGIIDTVCGDSNLYNSDYEAQIRVLLELLSNQSDQDYQYLNNQCRQLAQEQVRTSHPELINELKQSGMELDTEWGSYNRLHGTPNPKTISSQLAEGCKIIELNDGTTIDLNDAVDVYNEEPYLIVIYWDKYLEGSYWNLYNDDRCIEKSDNFGGVFESDESSLKYAKTYLRNYLS